MDSVMHSKPSSSPAPVPGMRGLRRRSRSGFTFLELLVALAILVAAFAVMFTIFTTTLSAWRRGNEVLTQLHHGDFVMDQLEQSLRSMSFFDSAPQFYEFRLEQNRAGGNPADRISWVTTSSAFMPMDSPYANSLHRIIVSVERTDRAEYGVAIRAMSHLSEEDDDSTDPWFVSTRVKGLRCRIYDPETEQWQEDWDKEGAIPSLVEVTLYMEPDEPHQPPIEMRRAIEIPLAPPITDRVDFSE